MVGTRSNRRTAVSQIYIVVALPLLLAVCALGVDVGRVYLAKAEAQSVADAAARYAARGMQSSSTPMTTARANAAAVAAESRVDGGAPTIDSADVIRGTYDAVNRTFTPDSTGDAISVTVRQSLNRSGAVPLLMSTFIGSQQTRIVATAVARTATSSTEIQPPASGNLWLSGMPNNTVFNNFRPDNSSVWDNSGNSGQQKQRPLELDLAALGLHEGDSICLEGISGTASWMDGAPADSINTADGSASSLAANGLYPATYVPSTSANGMSNVRAPIGAVMAVFLSDTRPDASGAPVNLDFGTSAARDYSSISPQLKQVFYVGDGKRANGEIQTITVPPGATRVFLGMMDAWQWNDNTGNFTTKLYRAATIQLVK